MIGAGLWLLLIPNLSDLGEPCPEGFRCCDSGCCLDKKTIWDSSSDSLRVLFIISLVMIPLLCICGLLKRFCQKCRKPEQNLRANHQIPPEAPPPIAPLEMIWVTPLNPPPPYNQVMMKPGEPPPPYSLRPEDPAGQMRSPDNPAL
ncbi:transmembrane protein 92 [Phodopus roborovskii]|uniref:transmembrane protein 92 n=1 Tax=Phodopus roborovskii TaxID=109678 RepID=UPI0021E3CB54|nr:transmembrane protein 92 [Phodopus roborovskii]